MLFLRQTVMMTIASAHNLRCAREVICSLLHVAGLVFGSSASGGWRLEISRQ